MARPGLPAGLPQTPVLRRGHGLRAMSRLPRSPRSIASGGGRMPGRRVDGQPGSRVPQPFDDASPGGE